MSYDLVELISLGLRCVPQKGCLEVPSVRYGWSEGVVPQRVSCPLQPLPRSSLTCLWLPSLFLFNCVNLNLTLPRDQKGPGWDPKHGGSLESPQAFCWEGASLELYSEQMVGCARPHCRILSQGPSAPGSRESKAGGAGGVPGTSLRQPILEEQGSPRRSWRREGYLRKRGRRPPLPGPHSLSS